MKLKNMLTTMLTGYDKSSLNRLINGLKSFEDVLLKESFPVAIIFNAKIGLEISREIDQIKSLGESTFNRPYLNSVKDRLKNVFEAWLDEIAPAFTYEEVVKLALDNFTENNLRAIDHFTRKRLGDYCTERAIPFHYESFDIFKGDDRLDCLVDGIASIPNQDHPVTKIYLVDDIVKVFKRYEFIAKKPHKYFRRG